MTWHELMTLRCASTTSTFLTCLVRSLAFQLLNRVYRIGQDRPVTVKKFFCAGTVEERLLALRKSKNSSLLASAEVATANAASIAPEADAMAVPAADGPDEDAEHGAETSIKMDDLRFIFGLQ